MVRRARRCQPHCAHQHHPRQLVQGVWLAWDHMGRKLAGAYDYVFAIRHDFQFITPVTEWAVDWARLLLHADPISPVISCIGCNPKKVPEWNDDPCSCRAFSDDKLIWVPRNQLPALLTAIWQTASDFVPHYLIHSFLTVPQEALTQQYDSFTLTLAIDPVPPAHLVWGHAVQVARSAVEVGDGIPAHVPNGCWLLAQRINSSWSEIEDPLLPPHLRAVLHPDVGFIRGCNIRPLCQVGLTHMCG